MNPKEKRGCKDILRQLTRYELLSLCDTVTKTMRSNYTKEEAIDEIIAFSGSSSEILNRRKITKDVLYDYLVYKRVSVTTNDTKSSLIEKTLKLWGTSNISDRRRGGDDSLYPSATSGNVFRFSSPPSTTSGNVFRFSSPPSTTSGNVFRFSSSPSTTSGNVFMFSSPPSTTSGNVFMFSSPTSQGCSATNYRTTETWSYTRHTESPSSFSFDSQYRHRQDQGQFNISMMQSHSQNQGQPKFSFGGSKYSFDNLR